MVENDKCLIWTSGPWIPCRGLDKDKPSIYFPDKNGRCPFNQCMAAVVLANPDLLARIIEPNSGTDYHFIKQLVYHAVCPGNINTNNDSNIIFRYTPENPFLNIHR